VSFKFCFYISLLHIVHTHTVKLEVIYFSSAKLQMLISRFEEIKMLEKETFGEFYTKISDLRNSIVSLRKSVSDVKLI